MTSIRFTHLEGTVELLNKNLDRAGSDLRYSVVDDRKGVTCKIKLVSKQYGHEHSFTTPTKAWTFVTGMMRGIQLTLPNADHMRGEASQ